MGTSMAPAPPPSSTTSTIVIKVGTSSLLNADLTGVKLSSMARICEAVRDLRKEGYKVVLVSSGAVGVGCCKMGLKNRPSKIAQKQAVSAVGQIHLMRYYQDFFEALGLTCAQVLLTLNNLSNRGPYLNARNTFQELLDYGTVPIVNENDTIAVEELRFGDNDTLSSQVATLVRADWLFLLTDVDSLYTANPSTHPEAVAIPQVHDLNKLKVDTVGKDTQWGTGGMVTKLTAARIATAAGCTMVICSSSEPELMPEIIKGKQAGTVFHPLPNAVRDRKRWILSVPVKGELWLDSGAVTAVRDHKKSLFAAGILKITGDFAAQDAIVLCDSNGYEFARGLCNYTLKEVQKVQGKSSKSFRDELGFVGSEEIIHRNNICLLSIIQSTDPDPPQDGTPILPTEDEPTPTRGGPSYQPHQDFNMGSSETNIPGLSQPSWGMQPQQQQQPPPQTGYQYPAGSVPMQTSQGYAGYGADSSQMYQQHYQSQGAPAYAGAAQNTQVGMQQGWPQMQQAAPIKQEPSLHPYTAPKQEPTPHAYSDPKQETTLPAYPHGNASSGAMFGHQAPASAAFNMPGQNTAYPSFNPSVNPGPATSPPISNPAFPQTGSRGYSSHNPDLMMQQQSSMPHQAPSVAPHGPQGGHMQRNSMPNQATHAGAAPTAHQEPHRGLSGPRGKSGSSQANQGHRKRQFDSGPSPTYRQPSYPPSAQPPKSSAPMGNAAGGINERMQILRGQGRSQGEDHDTDWHTELKTAIAAEQEADAAAMGGGGIAGFKPSASSAWRDADFRTQQGMQYGGYSNQPDINEQGWLPR